MTAKPGDPYYTPTTAWIAEMASRLAHMKSAPVADVWEAVDPLFPEVYGKPCDRLNAYHIALAAEVVRAVVGDREA